MEAFVTILRLLILVPFITKVQSIECYVCRSEAQNCQSGETDCTTLYDRCMKRSISNITTKECSSQILCNAGCIGKKDCQVDCCSGDLCNGSCALLSVEIMMVFVSMVIGKIVLSL